MARSSEKIQADVSLRQARKSGAHFKRLLAGGHNHVDGPSIREAHHKGHHIVIATTYEVRIDGKVFAGKLSVANSGEVHYHAIPTLGFASAVDMVKCVIDVFPDDFAGGSGGGGGSHAGGGAHPGVHAAHGARRKKRTNSRRT